MTKNQPTSQQPTQISKSQDPSHVSLLEQHKEFGICVETGGDGWFLQEVRAVCSVQFQEITWYAQSFSYIGRRGGQAINHCGAYIRAWYQGKSWIV